MLGVVHWGAGDWLAVAAVVQAVVLSVALGVAWWQASEARALRREQARPYVVVYAELNPVVHQLIDLVVMNLGQRPARDVTIKFEPALTTSLGVRDGESSPLTWTALDSGIPFLAPGQKMVHLLDSAIARYADENKQPNRYQVTVHYKESGSRNEGSRRQPTEHKETYEIDIKVWYGAEYINQLGVHDAVKKLQEIAETLKNWTYSFTGLNTYTTDRERFDEERSRVAKRLMEERQAANDAEPADPEGGEEQAASPEEPG